jgi:hypothetical protein
MLFLASSLNRIPFCNPRQVRTTKPTRFSSYRTLQLRRLLQPPQRHHVPQAHPNLRLRRHRYSLHNALPSRAPNRNPRAGSRTLALRHTVNTNTHVKHHRYIPSRQRPRPTSPTHAELSAAALRSLFPVFPSRGARAHSQSLHLLLPTPTPHLEPPVPQVLHAPGVRGVSQAVDGPLSW